MHVYHADCLRVMREVADEHGLVLVLDEIATGFGRTGTLFAAEAAGVAPDIMCVGKALTGGYLTLAAVLCTARGRATASRASESGRPDARPDVHGQPAGLRGRARQPRPARAGDWQAHVAAHRAGLCDGPRRLPRTLPGVADVRTLGAVGVVAARPPRRRASRRPTPRSSDGVWLRPFRDLVYTMPPYVSTDDDVARICAASWRVARCADDRARTPGAELAGRRRPRREREARPGCAGRCAPDGAATTPCSTWPATTTSASRGTRASSPAAAAAAQRWARGRRRLAPGDRHPGAARRARARRSPRSSASRRRWCSPPATTPTSPRSRRWPTATP